MTGVPHPAGFEADPHPTRSVGWSGGPVWLVAVVACWQEKDGAVVSTRCCLTARLNHSTLYLLYLVAWVQIQSEAPHPAPPLHDLLSVFSAGAGSRSHFSLCPRTVRPTSTSHSLQESFKGNAYSTRVKVRPFAG